MSAHTNTCRNGITTSAASSIGQPNTSSSSHRQINSVIEQQKRTTAGNHTAVYRRQRNAGDAILQAETGCIGQECRLNRRRKEAAGLPKFQRLVCYFVNVTPSVASASHRR